MKHFVLEGVLSVPSLRHEDSSFKHVASWVSCFLGLPLKVWAFTFLTHQDRVCDYLLPAALSACGNESAARYVRGSTRQLYCVPADRSMDSALQIAFAHFGALAKQQFLSQTFFITEISTKPHSQIPEAVWLVLAFSTTVSLEGMLRHNGFAFVNSVCSWTLTSLSL